MNQLELSIHVASNYTKGSMRYPCLPSEGRPACVSRIVFVRISLLAARDARCVIASLTEGIEELNSIRPKSSLYD